MSKHTDKQTDRNDEKHSQKQVVKNTDMKADRHNGDLTMSRLNGVASDHPNKRKKLSGPVQPEKGGSGM